MRSRSIFVLVLLSGCAAGAESEGDDKNKSENAPDAMAVSSTNKMPEPVNKTPDPMNTTPAPVNMPDAGTPDTAPASSPDTRMASQPDTRAQAPDTRTAQMPDSGVPDTQTSDMRVTIPVKGTKAQGIKCAVGDECASGFCSSGVCCDRSCTSSCESCVVTGSLGTCKILPAGTICGPPRCVVTSTSSVAYNMACDAQAKCRTLSSSCEARTCNVNNVPRDEGGYSQQAQCTSKCRSDSDCVSTLYKCDIFQGICYRK